MKLYSQCGFGDGEKTYNGMADGTIQGAIFSPKDILPNKLETKLGNYKKQYPNNDFFIDPQFYVNLHAAEPEAKLGKLTEWPCFSGYRRSQLEEDRVIENVLRKYIDMQCKMDVKAIIAPNIHISRSFDSIEASIAKKFIKQTAPVYDKYGDKRKVYASLVISREALLQQSEFELFLNDITSYMDPPDGIYLIVSSRSSIARTDIYNADVIANWMILNYAFNVNGLEIINGYSDIISPLLGIVGGNAGATGWWSNLRMFSMQRFLPTGSGGRLPIVRYLSRLLLNRIMFTEKDSFSTIVPKILNGLLRDKDYNPEPQRADEVLQSWETIAEINKKVYTSDIKQSLKLFEDVLDEAENAYIQIKARLAIDTKSNDEHIKPMREAIKIFKQRAEL